MFTKEHYAKVAEVLKDTLVGTKGSIAATLLHHEIVQDFVELFEDDNPKFDDEKFLDVIYGKEKK